MAKVIGIDLGTTNSVIAHEDHNGADIVLNHGHERGTPSVVGLHARRSEEPLEKRLLVGTAAVDNAARNPENTIFSIKRLMARFYDDPHVRAVQRRYMYRVEKAPDGEDVQVVLGEQRFTPTEISTMILRQLKEDAEKRLGDEVTHAVITVPAYFSVNQKLATRTAGEQAGLRVKTILTEPSAAAMAFGVDMEPGAIKHVLVYDLGGGTFDISVLFITGEMFNELAIEGDMWLGGDDFDHAIMDYVLQEIQKEYKTDPSSDGRFMLLLKKAAEKAKIQLSSMISTAISIDNIVPLPGGDRGDVDVELSRRTFEDLLITADTIAFGGVDVDVLRQWCEELHINGTYTDRGVEFGPDTVRNRIKKSILLARKAMLEARLTQEQIDHVLLVGGSTTIPLVQKMLEDEFGADKIMRNIDPMACVALGAGIAAARIPGIICQNVVEDPLTGEKRVCLEANGPDATVCRKCEGQLKAQKLCPMCNYANTMDAEQCANPAGCPHVFRRMESWNVLSKPIGILTVDDVYEVIVPKSTPYPTPEPIIQTFRTAQESQRAVRIPIFHAEINEFNPKDVDQWIGAADINLEGAHLPAETRVDVGIAIDRDGCLDIEARIQDGSGRRQRVFIDPHIGLGKQPGSINGDQEGAAEQEAGETTPEWEVRLQWSIDWAEIAMHNYEWLFSDHRVTQTLQRLVKEANEALARKDETSGRRLEEEIDGVLEKEFKGLMLLLWAEMRCLNRFLEPAQRSQGRSLIKDICDGIRQNGSVPELQQKMKQLNQWLTDTRNVGPEQASEGDTRLKR